MMNNSTFDMSQEKRLQKISSNTTIINHSSFNFKHSSVFMDDIHFNSSISTTTISTLSTEDIQFTSLFSNPITLDQPLNAYLSDLSRLFVIKIQGLVNSRHIFSSIEYPYSFTGEEAIDVLIEIIGKDWPRKEYKRIARSMMASKPPLFLPTLYSIRSLRNNTLVDSSKEIYMLNEETISEYTQGLLTPLLECYTPLCYRFYSNGCYAYDCPNRSPQYLSPKTRELHRNLSLNSSMASSQDTMASRCWASTVSRETIQRTCPKEMKRQEAIYELIYTEEDYVRDLNLLDELFAKPLSIAQCIEYERRESFCKEIFGNYTTILGLHQNIYRELRDYQLISQDTSLKGENAGFIDKIGKILLGYVDQFMDAYTNYCPQFILAEYIAKKEMTSNILFQNFIREKEKQAETRKLPFRHYLILPITRLQRYPLLLEAILKRTTEENEQNNLRICIDHIKDVASKMDKLTNDMKKIVHIRQMNDKIQFKPGVMPYKINLLKPGRQLIHEGLLKRRINLGVDSVELYVFLFDHLLLMTKPKRNAAGQIESFVVYKKPIPLTLMTISELSEGSSLFTSFKSKNNTTNSYHTNSTLISESMSFTSPNSILVRHLGRLGDEYILLADSPNARTVWRESLLLAQKQLTIKENKHQVFSVTSISDTMFAFSGTVNNHGKVTCATSFVGHTAEKMIVLGTQQGLWIGKESNPNTLKRVLKISDVTQIAVLQSQRILLVLADKVLTAYSIAQLDPSNPNNVIYKIAAMKKPSDKSVLAFRVLSSHATYFNTGVCNNRTLVIIMKRKVADSHFKAFEPVCGDLSDSRNSKYLSTKTSFINKPLAWFKTYKEFYVGSDSTAIHFLRSKVVIQCHRGFEVLDPERLSDVQHNLPDLHQHGFHFIVHAEAIPLGIFKYQDRFLLCYDKFAFLVTAHGELVQDRYTRIEWESQPRSVAFFSPYILAFDDQFIEVRHIETGKLVQVITGDHTRLLSSAFTNTNMMGSTIYAKTTHPFKIDYQDIIKLEPLFSTK